VIGIFFCNILPFFIWHCGTVAERNGYLTPLQKLGEYKDENPVKFVELCNHAPFLDPEFIC